jgi:hypothetical protein
LGVVPKSLAPTFNFTEKKAMSTWYSKALGDGVDALAPTTQIQQAYLALSLATRLPIDCAIFSYYDLQANVVTVYFTPSAMQLAKSFGAVPCDPPVNKEGFGLLNGEMRVWEVLFGK